MKHTRKLGLGLLLISSSLILGCSSSDDDTQPVVTPKLAVTVGATANYSSASHALIDSEAPYTANTELAASADTDVAISGHGAFFYRISRFGANHITKYSTSAPDTAIWQCSTEGSESNSNPYELIQVADDKAYVLRYGSGKLWVVDPSIAGSADCATGFKTGEIDLSGFDSDGIPEMSAGVVVGNYLFVALQRLTAFTPVQDALVVVIDITTDQIVDVDDNTAGTQAITLSGRNPGSMQYVASLDRIFVQSVGKYDSTAFGGTPAEYTGGIDVIDPVLLTAQQLIDDTETTTRQISAMAVIDDATAYLVSYAGWGDNSLYRFNPADGSIASDNQGAPIAVAGLAGINIAGIKAGPHGKLWVLVDSGLTLIDPTDDSVVEPLIDTRMNPSDLVFVDNP